MSTLDGLLEECRQNQVIPEAHPDFEALLRLAERQADEQERVQLLDHISDCRPCADLLLQLREEATTQEDSQEVRGELHPFPAPPRPIWKRLTFAYSIAAACLLAVLLQATGTRHTQSTIRGGAYFGELVARSSSGGNVTRSMESGTSLPAGRELMLLLTTTHLDTTPQLQAVIQGDGLQQPLIIEQLLPAGDGALPLLIPADALAPGTYTLKTRDFQAGSWQDLDTYVFTIAP